MPVFSLATSKSEVDEPSLYVTFKSFFQLNVFFSEVGLDRGQKIVPTLDISTKFSYKKYWMPYIKGFFAVILKKKLKPTDGLFMVWHALTRSIFLLYRLIDQISLDGFIWRTKESRTL